MNNFEIELIGCCWNHRVIAKDKKHIEADGTFFFPQSFTGFQGHFPNQPVLPAVIQLTMIRLLAEQTLTQRLSPIQYGKTKFRHIIQPEQDVLTKINLTLEEQGVNCQYKIKLLDGQTISDGVCFFEYI